MDPEVLAAFQAWRAMLDDVDELVRRVGGPQPLHADELVAAEEAELDARRRYYRLLQQRYGFPAPRGLDTTP